ncbi:MAG: hypothetical protein LQ342_004485 [Letrouitia transgressa]|nr:MAG: hypothetical protein LQ342_004485 [Letrouitia transgressa]
MVDKYNSEARQAGLSEGRMHAVQGDLLATAQGLLGSQEFENFDLAIMSMALHHVENPCEIVAKLVDRLKPGGTIAIIDWVGLEYPPVRVHNQEEPMKCGTGSDIMNGHGHEMHSAAHTILSDGFTKEQMQAMFDKSGCRYDDFVLAASPSKVPSNPSGQKQMFFAKGIK